MKVRNKKTACILFLVGSVLVAYMLWLFFRPVKIVAVHQRNNYSDVLVRSFPFTDQGKINWWLKNNDILKSLYDIPKPETDGGYVIDFRLFGDGYKVYEEKYDRLCFDDMKTEKNCIEKDSVFIVSNSRDNTIFFTVDNGRYRLENDGTVTKLKDW